MSKTGKAKSIRRIAKDLELHAEAADLLDPPTIKHYTPDF